MVSPKTISQIALLAVDAQDGTMWYAIDHVPPVFVGKLMVLWFDFDGSISLRLNMNICGIENCNKPVHGRKLCNKHYRRLQRNEFKSLDVVFFKDSGFIIKEKFDRSFSINDSGCWIWNHSLNHYGYGRIMIDGERLMAHAASYMLYKVNLIEI